MRELTVLVGMSVKAKTVATIAISMPTASTLMAASIAHVKKNSLVMVLYVLILTSVVYFPLRLNKKVELLTHCLTLMIAMLKPSARTQNVVIHVHECRILR